jgi:hypothetical protein
MAGGAAKAARSQPETGLGDRAGRGGKERLDFKVLRFSPRKNHVACILI